MGTCIGKRNVIYFLSFLWMTAFHAAGTFGLTLAFFLIKTNGDLLSIEDNMERKLVTIDAGIMGYCLLIGSTLFFFAIYSTCLHLGNVTSNENLRTRWNAQHEVKVERERSRIRAVSPGNMNAQE